MYFRVRFIRVQIIQGPGPRSESRSRSRFYKYLKNRAMIQNDKKEKRRINFKLIITILLPSCQCSVRKRRQLGFFTRNRNLAVNLKPTHPFLLNGKGQFTFLKIKSSRSSGIVVYPPKSEFLRN